MIRLYRTPKVGVCLIKYYAANGVACFRNAIGDKPLHFFHSFHIVIVNIFLQFIFSAVCETVSSLYFWN